MMYCYLLNRPEAYGLAKNAQLLELLFYKVAISSSNIAQHAGCLMLIGGHELPIGPVLQKDHHKLRTPNMPWLIDYFWGDSDELLLPNYESQKTRFLKISLRWVIRIKCMVLCPNEPPEQLVHYHRFYKSVEVYWMTEHRSSGRFFPQLVLWC